MEKTYPVPVHLPLALTLLFGYKRRIVTIPGSMLRHDMHHFLGNTLTMLSNGSTDNAATCR